MRRDGLDVSRTEWEALLDAADEYADWCRVCDLLARFQSERKELEGRSLALDYLRGEVAGAARSPLGIFVRRRLRKALEVTGTRPERRG